MTLDIQSAISIAAVMSLMLALSLRFVLADYPASLRPGLGMWIMAMAVACPAWVLYGLRGQMPAFIAIVVANALLSLSWAYQQHALRRFVGWRSGAAVYAPVLAIALVEIVFGLWRPGIRERTVCASLVIAWQLGSCVWVLARAARPLSRSAWLTAAAFGLPTVILLLRAAYEGLRTQTLTTAYAATPMQVVVFGIAAFAPLLATLGFVSMCNERLNQALRRQALLDPLTGIGNRRALMEAGERAVAAAERRGDALAMLLVDADHFKVINDRHGHDAGDLALCTLVDAARGVLTEHDRFGRFGGEEFIALLPGVDEEHAQATAERLRAAVAAAQFRVRQQAVPLRVSVGVAVMQSGDDLSALLRRADQAMYFAKRRGRDCVVGPRQMREARRATGDPPPEPDDREQPDLSVEPT